MEQKVEQEEGEERRGEERRGEERRGERRGEERRGEERRGEERRGEERRREERRGEERRGEERRGEEKRRHRRNKGSRKAGTCRKQRAATAFFFHTFCRTHLVERRPRAIGTYGTVATPRGSGGNCVRRPRGGAGLLALGTERPHGQAVGPAPGVFLGADSFSILFNNQLNLQGFWWFSGKKDSWKEWGSYPRTLESQLQLFALDLAIAQKMVPKMAP